MKKNNVILVIDQNLNRRNNLSSRLRVQGYSTELVSSGFQALSHLEEGLKTDNKSYDLVLIIEDSEDMPGREILLLMREVISQKQLLPILVADQDNDPEIILNTIQEGANDYIVDLHNEGKIITKIKKYAPLSHEK